MNWGKGIYQLIFLLLLQTFTIQLQTIYLVELIKDKRITFEYDIGS